MEAIKTQLNRFRQPDSVKIYGVRIRQEGSGTYSVNVRHTGHFRLEDFDEIDVEVKSVRLVRRES